MKRMGRVVFGRAALFCAFFAPAALAADPAPRTWGSGKPPVDVIQAAPPARVAPARPDCSHSDDEAEFDAVAHRYEKIIAFRERLEERDQAQFDAQVRENEREIRFTRELEAAREAEELELFRQRLERALRIRTFLARLLERVREARPHVPPPLADEPEEWDRAP